MVIGSKIEHMEKAHIFTVTELNTQVIGLKIDSMEWDWKHGRTILPTKGSMFLGKNKEMACSHGKGIIIFVKF